MKTNSKFQPVYGSQKAIDESQKISGQLYFSTEGKIFLDTDDGVRIPVADKTQSLVYKQSIASSSWVIKHNLSRFPVINIYDTDGNELIGDTEYTDENTVTIKFTKSCVGIAYIN